MWIKGLLLLVGAYVVLGAPVSLDQEPPRTHRESTKAILDLEQELKAQAGENKQFYPSLMQPILPALTQGDLEGSGEDEEAQLVKTAMKPVVIDALADSDADPEDMNHIKRTEQPASPENSIEETKEEKGEEEEDKEEEEEVEHSPLRSSKEAPPVENPEEDEYDDYEEKLFLQSVMDTLREHPEMVEQLLGEASESKNSEVYDTIPPDVDTQDRDEEIKAEVLQAEAQNNPGQQSTPDEDELRSLASEAQVYRELQQEYKGDQTAKVVSKKRGYGPPIYENEIEEKDSDLYDGDLKHFTPEELEELKAYYDALERKEEEEKHGVSDSKRALAM